MEEARGEEVAAGGAAGALETAKEVAWATEDTVKVEAEVWALADAVAAGAAAAAVAAAELVEAEVGLAAEVAAMEALPPSATRLLARESSTGRRH